MSVNRTPNQRTGGLRRFLEDWLNLTASAPIWFAGMIMQRDKSSFGQVIKKEDFEDIRAGIRAVSYTPTYAYWASGEFPTDFTTAPDSSPFTTVVGVIIGTMGLPHKSDHSTAYKAGEHVKCVSQTQTIESTASLQIPVIIPVSEDAGGDGWSGSDGQLLADSSNLTGAYFRKYQQAMSDYVGVAYENVGATVGAYFNVDVTVLLTTPPVQIDST